VRVVFGVAVGFVGEELPPQRVVAGRGRREQVVEVRRHGARLAGSAAGGLILCTGLVRTGSRRSGGLCGARVVGCVAWL
jgi:hypothetical protein